MSNTEALKVLLIQGPNMAYLGERQPHLYGTTTAKELDALCYAHSEKHGYHLDILYTNHEGVAVDRIWEERAAGLSGLVMNPAAFSFPQGALVGCLTAMEFPYVEIHMRNSDLARHKSLLAPLAKGVILGFGIDTYRMGLDAMYRILTKTQDW